MRNGKKDDRLLNGALRKMVSSKELIKSELKEEESGQVKHEEHEELEAYEFTVKTKTKGTRVIRVTKEDLERLKRYRCITSAKKEAVRYLHLLKDCIPRFDISEEVGEIILEYLKRENPELYEFIREYYGL